MAETITIHSSSSPQKIESFPYIPEGWNLFTDFNRPGKQNHDWRRIEEKAGLYEVRIRPPFDHEDARLYIGTTGNLRQRIRYLITSPKQHAYNKLIADYAALLKENITTASQLLQIQWSYMTTFAFQRLEIAMHLYYDPLFPDKNIFPAPETHLAELKTLEERLQEIYAQHLPQGQLNGWIAEQLNLSQANAQRYLNLLKWKAQAFKNTKQRAI